MVRPVDSAQVDSVYVRKVKRPAGSGLWGAYVLARDRYGLWLHTPKGSRYRGEDGNEPGFCEAAQVSPGGEGRDTVLLIPRSGWWIATWYGRSDPMPITVDICTPPKLIGSEWRYTDLELDPYLRRSGVVETDDRDEFAAACAAGTIPPHEQEAARHATAEIERSLGARLEPFGDAGFARLEQALSTALPPLVDFGDAPLFVTA